VRDYLREFRKGTIVNNRVKIIIVGNGRSGKTSIFRRIKDLPFREDEAFTHGIKLGDFDKKDLPDVKTAELQANVWDFGGQEIFYATHQFFLTDDALYILAWTKEENVIPHRERDKAILPTNEKWRSREYWLESIRHHGKGSPILMVQTHSDKSREIINPLEYKKEPYNADCLDFSAFDDEGLSQLKRQITLKLNEEITEFGKPSPKTYIQVINEVENRRNQNRMSREEFVEICMGAGITPEAENSVLNFLRVTGSVVWFPTVAALQDTVFINPDWLTKQVYRLINNDLHIKKGRLSEAYLDTVFPDYSNEERQQFLELLKGFELIFEDKSVETDRFIAPQYLPEKLEADTKQLYDDIFEELHLAFKFRFPKFIPDNVMVNFLSRYGPFSRKVYWKNGIFFKHHNTEKCIVTFEESSNCLFVYTKKDEPNSQFLQYEVCQAFVELSKNANAEIALEESPFVSWQKLVEAHKLENKNLLATDDTTIVSVSDFVLFLDPRNSKLMGEDFRSVGFAAKGVPSVSLPIIETAPVIDEPLEHHPSTGKTKILFIAANPDDTTRINIGKEHRRITEELQRGKERDQYEFLNPMLDVTISGLLGAINAKPNIVHFSGHGSTNGIFITDENNPSQAILIPTVALKAFFKQLKGSTEIVLLNSCYSAEQAKTISLFGIYVVGNNTKITDKAAIAFSIGFYTGKAAGESFEKSFEYGRIALLAADPLADDILEVWKDGVQLNPETF
jgi:GTPase SAR1 family protein